MLVNRWRLPPHPAVTLAADRSWIENPFYDRNWQYLDHSLGILHSLFRTYTETGDTRYRTRAAVVLRDWVEDNPRYGSRSIFAWNDHATAHRAVVLACASRYLARDAWLQSALVLHGKTLADPGFYRYVGNHALNQNIGLLEIAHVLGRSDWKSLAVNRLSTLAANSIDAQGVTNEQAIGYQYYNYKRYSHARARIQAMGLAIPTSFGRVALMPRILAFATLPNGEYETIGDSDRQRSVGIPGTWAEFAAWAGQRGPRPPDTVAVYGAGYLFARSGWGDRRAFADEVALSLRWGPAQAIHGHLDHGAVTLYGSGARLLVDPGKYTYNANAWRSYFVGRSAHNVVTVDGVGWSGTARSDLLNTSRNSTMVTARVRMTGYPGVSHVRGVTFSRRLNYVLVDDRLGSSTWRTYRQLWHLTEDARPLVESSWFRTQRTRGNVQVRQLIASGATSRTVTGRTSPIQGWLAWEFGVRRAAPVVEVRKTGTSLRFLTLLVTAPGSPASGVSELKLTSNGYSVVIKVGAKKERVVVSGSSVSITPLN